MRIRAALGGGLLSPQATGAVQAPTGHQRCSRFGAATRGRADRGATMVEYALGVALLVVACLGAISFLEDESRDSLDESSDLAGNPDGLEAGSPGGSTGGTTGGDTGGTTTDGSTDPADAPDGVVVSSITGTSTIAPPDWVATVSVIASDSSGALAQGVLVTGTWDPAVAGSTVSCTTGADGRCVFTQQGMKRSGGNSIPQTTFTVTSMTFPTSSPPVTYTLPDPPPSITMNESGPVT